MIEYSVDSIDFERCKKTPEIILQFLAKCDNCFKLPIPQYKSFKQQNKTYCKTCYMSNFNLDDIIYPSRIDINILEKLIINCSNMNCEREFNINTLNEMIEHEKICCKIKVIDNHNNKV
jgi:hypothetical protein